MKLLLIIWQLPQYLLGLLVLAWHKVFMQKRHLFTVELHVDIPHVKFHSYNRRRYDGRYLGFSLGYHVFFYYNDSYMCKPGSARWSTVILPQLQYHEYAHSIQSLYLGWFYLPIIAIPSLVMTSIGMSDRCFTERWAENIVEQLYDK